MIALFRAIIILTVLSLFVVGAPTTEAQSEGLRVPHLKGQLLVARDHRVSSYFGRTVIYIADHDDQGAFGLIVNKPLGEAPIGSLIDDGVEGPTVTIFQGGPVDISAGFILHSLDYEDETTIANRGAAAISFSNEILKAIREGRGPETYLIAIGYSGWRAGQLEDEFKRGSWDVAPFDPAIVFDDEIASKWQRARDSLAQPL